VILDWTPRALPDRRARPDRTSTARTFYEHADPRKGMHADTGSAIFNYGRNEVRTFLISNAHFWLDRYHRRTARGRGGVDAVPRLRAPGGDWIPNQWRAGKTRSDALLRGLQRERLPRRAADTQTIARESTSWPGVRGRRTRGPASA
jgi:1,4-alpha-glucan branching enzyme